MYVLCYEEYKMMNIHISNGTSIEIQDGVAYYLCFDQKKQPVRTMLPPIVFLTIIILLTSDSENVINLLQTALHTSKEDVGLFIEQIQVLYQSKC